MCDVLAVRYAEIQKYSKIQKQMHLDDITIQSAVWTLYLLTLDQAIGERAAFGFTTT